ncbi:hypothetical protein CBL_13404 [Carabus blaptoides fortunei]
MRSRKESIVPEPDTSLELVVPFLCCVLYGSVFTRAEIQSLTDTDPSDSGSLVGCKDCSGVHIDASLGRRQLPHHSSPVCVSLPTRTIIWSRLEQFQSDTVDIFPLLRFAMNETSMYLSEIFCTLCIRRNRMPTSALVWSIHSSFRLSGAFTSCHDQCPSLARSSIIKQRVVEIVYPVFSEPCNARTETLMNSFPEEFQASPYRSRADWAEKGYPLSPSSLHFTLHHLLSQASLWNSSHLLYGLVWHKIAFRINNVGDRIERTWVHGHRTGHSTLLPDAVPLLQLASQSVTDTTETERPPVTNGSKPGSSTPFQISIEQRHCSVNEARTGQLNAITYGY